MAGTGTAGWVAAVGTVVQGIPHPLAQRLEHRHLDRGTLTRTMPHQQGGQDAGVRIHPGRDIGNRDTHFDRLVRCARDRQQSGLRLHQQVICLPVSVGTTRAIAGDPAYDQPRMCLTQRGGRQPEPLGGARGKILHEDVATVEQATEHLAGIGMLDIERQRFLRPVQPDEV